MRLSQNMVERPAFDPLAFLIVAQHPPGDIKQRKDIAAGLTQKQRGKPLDLGSGILGVGIFLVHDARSAQ